MSEVEIASIQKAGDTGRGATGGAVVGASSGKGAFQELLAAEEGGFGGRGQLPDVRSCEVTGAGEREGGSGLSTPDRQMVVEERHRGSWRGRKGEGERTLAGEEISDEEPQRERERAKGGEAIAVSAVVTRQDAAFSAGQSIPTDARGFAGYGVDARKVVRVVQAARTTGSDRVSMRLTLPGGHEVVLEARIEGKVVKMTIFHDSLEARAVITSAVSDLQDALGRTGMELGEIDFRRSPAPRSGVDVIANDSGGGSETSRRDASRTIEVDDRGDWVMHVVA